MGGASFVPGSFSFGALLVNGLLVFLGTLLMYRAQAGGRFSIALDRVGWFLAALGCAAASAQLILPFFPAVLHPVLFSAIWAACFWRFLKYMLLKAWS